eukprot:PLAT6672.4.p1 GENE.PLAT6672.4~~PLAT6672.4.p1  ORF type:complete len:381 (-),score=159.12 PLAT6672.4:1187-2173(-)
MCERQHAASVAPVAALADVTASASLYSKAGSGKRRSAEEAAAAAAAAAAEAAEAAAKEAEELAAGGLPSDGRPRIIVSRTAGSSGAVVALAATGVRYVVKQMRGVDFVLSVRMGVLRLPQKQLLDRHRDGSLRGMLSHLKARFTKPYLLVENDRESDRQKLQPRFDRALVGSLAVRGVGVLFTATAEASARMLVTMMSEEVSRGHGCLLLNGLLTPKASRENTWAAMLSQVPLLHYGQVAALLCAFRGRPFKELLAASAQQLQEALPSLPDRAAKAAATFFNSSFAAAKRRWGAGSSAAAGESAFAGSSSAGSKAKGRARKRAAAGVL